VASRPKAPSGSPLVPTFSSPSAYSAPSSAGSSSPASFASTIAARFGLTVPPPRSRRSRFARAKNRLHRTRWVVYAKRPFGGPEQVFRYLGRYTHRIGLSSRRLASLDDRGVVFRTHGDQTVTLAPDEFLRRFFLHVLPKGYVKIRHHGLMAASNVTTRLVAARRLLERAPPPAAPDVSRNPADFREVLLALTGVDLRRCPRCGELAMRRHPLPLAVVAPTPPDTS